MKFLSMFLVFGGYLLVYAATANSGRFATEPWAGVLADAYTVPPTHKQTIPPLMGGATGPILPHGAGAGAGGGMPPVH